MYRQFFGFKEKPFKLVPDPRFLYMSEAHKAAISHLQYGLEERNGFVVITGEVGSGKTLLLRVLMNEIPRTTHVARIINTNFNAKELLEHILNEFGIETQDETKPRMISLLTQFLFKSFSEGRDAILIVDEAQNLSIDALEELRMVSNLETNTEKLIQIVMVGQPQLRYKLNLPDLEQLRQRVTVQYHIPALNAADTIGYVNHRLAVARGEPVEIFTPPAIGKIYEYSGGIPRLINVVSDAGLRFGYVEEKQTVDADLMAAVIEELQEGDDTTDEAAPSPAGSARALDVGILELNKKFQHLYDQMQKIYVRKGEESRIAYERVLNVEKEMMAKEGLYNLQERERMIFEKEGEIHQKLLEVSSRLDEVNVLKENLEQSRLDVHEKVRQMEAHLKKLQEKPPPRRKFAPEGGGESEQEYRKKLAQLEKTEKKLQQREQELIAKMEGLKAYIRELQEKKVYLDTLGQEQSLEERLGELEVQQKLVRRNEEELVGKIALLEERIDPGEIQTVNGTGKPQAAQSPPAAEQEDILLDLISRVDRLKSDIDSLELQKQFFHSLEAGKGEAESSPGKERFEKSYASLKKREEQLIRKITDVKKLFKTFEDKAGSMEALADRFLKKERLLESKFDELRDLILRVEERAPAVAKGDGGLAQVLAGKAGPGRRFSSLVRDILKEL